MTIERMFQGIVGTMILVSVALTHYVSPHFVWFTVFIGANLLQSAFTNWCLLSRILAKAGFPAGGTCGIQN